MAGTSDPRRLPRRFQERCHVTAGCMILDPIGAFWSGSSVGGINPSENRCKCDMTNQQGGWCFAGSAVAFATLAFICGIFPFIALSTFMTVLIFNPELLFTGPPRDA